MTTSRPLSPHLQVYRWQLTMVLSILHRATGAALAVGALMVACWLMNAAGGPDSFARFHEFAASPLGKFMLFGWLFSLCYHFLNGIRHLVWDTGAALSIPATYIGGYIVAALSIVSTIAIWCCA